MKTSLLIFILFTMASLNGLAQLPFDFNNQSLKFEVFMQTIDSDGNLIRPRYFIGLGGIGPHSKDSISKKEMRELLSMMDDTTKDWAACHLLYFYTDEEYQRIMIWPANMWRAIYLKKEKRFWKKYIKSDNKRASRPAAKQGVLERLAASWAFSVK